MNKYKEFLHEADNDRPLNSVQPKDCCLRFAERTAFCVPRAECWYCKYADFQLKQEKPLAVGYCCYPNIIVD